MKLTKIRRAGKKLNDSALEHLAIQLSNAVKRRGYITEIHRVNCSSLKVGIWQRTFKVNIYSLGYNARYNPHSVSKKGYVRTSSPTWDQRVKFNDIINEVLTKNKIDCNVKSGSFLIRHGFTSYEEQDWENQKPDYMLHNESRGYIVKPLPKSLASRDSQFKYKALARESE